MSNGLHKQKDAHARSCNSKEMEGTMISRIMYNVCSD